MNRRSFLATFGASIVAGCAGVGSTPTPTPTPKPTPTPTPEPKRPNIADTSLLYEWTEFGDVLDKQFSAVGKGAQAIVGFRYQAEVHDGTADYTEQVRIFGPDGNRIDMQQSRDEQLVSGEGYQEWEHALYFDTTTWDFGSYEHEVLIRDNITDKVSETSTGEFQVNRPLGPDEGVLWSIDHPNPVAVDEDYSFTLELGNQADRDGSVVTSLSSKYQSDDEWYTYPNTTVAVNVATQRTNTWASTSISFNYTGTVRFRLDELDETWEVDVIEN